MILFNDLKKYISQLSPTFQFGHSKYINDTNLNLFKHIPNKSIDLIITSPPYETIIDYVKFDSHNYNYLSINKNEIRKKMTGEKSKGITSFYEDLMKCYINCYNVLKKGKLMIVCVGNINNLPKKCVNFGINIGFTVELIIEIPRFNKNFTKKYNEFIIIMKK